MEWTYGINSLKDAAEKLLQAARNYKVWTFYGDMGAGKTTVIQALCQQMHVTGSFGSPTFSIINEYVSADGPVYHIDLYRCKNEEEAIRAGVEECLYSGRICMVEWPSRAEGIMPPDSLRITITVIDEFTRKLTVQPFQNALH